jgi:serine/threonine protein kinase
MYSAASDVWSFGVLCWEIVTLGSTPYPGMSGPEVMTFVQKGCRMPKPPNTTDAIYAIMKDCWQQFPPKRPQFSLLRHRLVAILDEPPSPSDQLFVDQMADNIYEIIEDRPGEKC